MKRFIVITEIQYDEIQDRTLTYRPLSDQDVAAIKVELQSTFNDVVERLISDDGPTFNVQIIEGIHTDESHLAH